GSRPQFRYFLLQSRQTRFRISQPLVSFRLYFSRFCNRGANCFRIRAKYWQLRAKSPKDHTRYDREIDPFEKLSRMFRCSIAFFCSSRRTSTKQQHAAHTHRDYGQSTQTHRAPLGEAASITRLAISAASCGAPVSSSRFAAATSFATFSFAALTSEAAKFREAFSNSARSSSSFFRASSCSAYT